MYAKDNYYPNNSKCTNSDYTTKETCENNHDWYESCTQFCDSSLTCNGNGTCNEFGKCECNIEFEGENCSVCGDEYYPKNGDNICTKQCNTTICIIMEHVIY